MAYHLSKWQDVVLLCTGFSNLSCGVCDEKVPWTLCSGAQLHRILPSAGVLTSLVQNTGLKLAEKWHNRYRGCEGVLYLRR